MRSGETATGKLFVLFCFLLTKLEFVKWELETPHMNWPKYLMGVGEAGNCSRRSWETKNPGTGQMGVGETGIGKMGAGETGRTDELRRHISQHGEFSSPV